MKKSAASRNIILEEMFRKVLPQQMLAGLVFTLNSLIDSLVTSRLLGSDAMAALGFYSPISNILYLCYVFITGTQILCGNSIGRGKAKETVSIFTTCALILTVFAVISSAVLFILPS
ncbi:MAG: hypothetical protein GX685_10040 [Clostridiales bacterium]|nr:hypothetical protein [Clostridiales bacterium]